MAYRFLLEVPEAIANEANVTVSSVDDSQVVVVRRSHGLGFDESSVDLTIAAHSLAVIRAFYDWFADLPTPKPQIALVLHGGQRVPLSGTDHGQMVALIRRDQPWVERTLPKIGEHQRDILPASNPTGSVHTDLLFRAPQQTFGAPVSTPTRQLKLLNRVEVAVQVTELERAERYYVDFLGMTLYGREREDAHGDLEPVESGYDGAVALTMGTEADVSYLGNGSVTIALDRVGRGARLGRSDGAPIPIDVDRSSFFQLKADAFMRGMEIIGDSPDALVVRDIYGLVWQFTVPVDLPARV